MSKPAPVVALVLATLFAIACFTRGAPSPSSPNAAGAPARIAAARPIETPARPLERERAALAAHREQQIARLREYALRAQFPHNRSASPKPLHMFRDADGTLCPIANLIHLDGHAALVDRMAREHNDVVVADQAHGPLHDWVLTSGLTNEEVRRIQGVGFPGEDGLEAKVVDVEALALQARLLAVVNELMTDSHECLALALERLPRGALALD